MRMDIRVTLLALSLFVTAEAVISSRPPNIDPDLDCDVCL
jgi:hypothetical protein